MNILLILIHTSFETTIERFLSTSFNIFFVQKTKVFFPFFRYTCTSACSEQQSSFYDYWIIYVKFWKNETISKNSDFKNLYITYFWRINSLGKIREIKNLKLSLYKSQFKIKKSKLAKQLIDSHTTSYRTVVVKK